MTRLDLFKQWLVEQGVNRRDLCLEEIGDMPDRHGCAMMTCPDSVERDEEGFFICKTCPYNEFWTKEVDDDEV